MPAPPQRYRIYRWKSLPYQEKLRLFASVHIDAISAQRLIDFRYFVEDDGGLPSRFGDENVSTVFGGMWYFPRELVVEVKGSAPRKPRKRHAITA